MGVTLNVIDSKFIIKKENQKLALKALKEYGKNRFEHATYCTRKSNEIKTARHIEDAFKVWMYYLKFDDETDDVINILYEGEKLSDDLEMFNSIASYVEKGSYLEVTFDGEGLSRWVFDGQTCKEIQPTITWEMPK
jgi:hypothetical protein